ncbi:MAG TPA: hypothetical protein PKA13_23935 [Geminicoccaceae bacterium]|nr:hypothetical protein [Geminicoccus sp.]HMU52847.1 hypothetical protein [Geminicoccaceae bacterium]
MTICPSALAGRDEDDRTGPVLDALFPPLRLDREVIAYGRGPHCILSFEAVALPRGRGYRVRRLGDGFPEGKAAGLAAEIAAR